MQLVSNINSLTLYRCQPKEIFSTLHGAEHHMVCHQGSCELIPPLISAPVALLISSWVSALFLTMLGSNIFLDDKYYLPTLRKMFKVLYAGRTEVHSLN